MVTMADSLVEIITGVKQTRISAARTPSSLFPLCSHSHSHLDLVLPGLHTILRCSEPTQIPGVAGSLV